MPQECLNERRQLLYAACNETAKQMVCGLCVRACGARTRTLRNLACDEDLDPCKQATWVTILCSIDILDPYQCKHVYLPVCCAGQPNQCWRVRQTAGPPAAGPKGRLFPAVGGGPPLLASKHATLLIQLNLWRHCIWRMLTTHELYVLSLECIGDGVDP